MKKITIATLASLLSLFVNAQDQKFLDFQSAKVAFEKYNDCPEAEKLLKPIQEDFKSDMSFVHLYAKVLKCLNKYQEALTVLQKYNAVAQDPQIEEEIAELNYKLKANNLTGPWTITSSNGDEYAVSSLTIDHKGNAIYVRNSYEEEYGSATLLSEDDEYAKYRGTYRSTYYYTHRYQTALQKMYGAGAYNEEGRKTNFTWSNIYYTYNKKTKTFSFDVPQGRVDNDGNVSKAYGQWSITAKRK